MAKLWIHPEYRNLPEMRRLVHLTDQATVYSNLIDLGLPKRRAYWLASRWPSAFVWNVLFGLAIVAATVLGMRY